MTGPTNPRGPDRFEVRGTAADHFAWVRTRLALERTMMAWQRTSIALIGFGFAIVQYFGRFEDLPGARPARFPDAPRYLGLALILCGVLALIVSIAQYLWMTRYLRSGTFGSIALIADMPRAPTQTPALAVAVVLLGIGLFAFFAVLTRLA